MDATTVRWIITTLVALCGYFFLSPLGKTFVEPVLQKNREKIIGRAMSAGKVVKDIFSFSFSYVAPIIVFIELLLQFPTFNRWAVMGEILSIAALIFNYFVSSNSIFFKTNSVTKDHINYLYSAVEETKANLFLDKVRPRFVATSPSALGKQPQLHLLNVGSAAVPVGLANMGNGFGNDWTANLNDLNDVPTGQAITVFVTLLKENVNEIIFSLVCSNSESNQMKFSQKIRFNLAKGDFNVENPDFF